MLLTWGDRGRFREICKDCWPDQLQPQARRPWRAPRGLSGAALRSGEHALVTRLRRDLRRNPQSTRCPPPAAHGGSPLATTSGGSCLRLWLLELRHGPPHCAGVGTCCSSTWWHCRWWPVPPSGRCSSCPAAPQASPHRPPPMCHARSPPTPTWPMPAVLQPLMATGSAHLPTAWAPLAGWLLRLDVGLAWLAALAALVLVPADVAAALARQPPGPLAACWKAAYWWGPHQPARAAGSAAAAATVPGLPLPRDSPTFPSPSSLAGMASWPRCWCSHCTWSSLGRGSSRSMTGCWRPPGQRRTRVLASGSWPCTRVLWTDCPSRLRGWGPTCLSTLSCGTSLPVLCVPCCRTNLMYYAVLLCVALAGLVLLLFSGRLQPANILGFGIAFSNAYGLVAGGRRALAAGVACLQAQASWPCKQAWPCMQAWLPAPAAWRCVPHPARLPCWQPAPAHLRRPPRSHLPAGVWPGGGAAPAVEQRRPARRAAARLPQRRTAGKAGPRWAGGRARRCFRNSV